MMPEIRVRKEQAQMMNSTCIFLDPLSDLAYWTPKLETDRLAVHQDEPPRFPDNSISKMFTDIGWFVEWNVPVVDQGPLDMRNPDVEMLRIPLQVLFDEMCPEFGMAWPLQIANRTRNKDTHEWSCPRRVKRIRNALCGGFVEITHPFQGP